MSVDEFDWDPLKAAANIAYHGVSFEQAKDIVRGPFAVEFEDDRENYGEARYVIRGPICHHRHDGGAIAHRRVHHTGE